jgi:hypothetical protein
VLPANDEELFAEPEPSEPVAVDVAVIATVLLALVEKLPAVMTGVVRVREEEEVVVVVGAVKVGIVLSPRTATLPVPVATDNGVNTSVDLAGVWSCATR